MLDCVDVGFIDDDQILDRLPQPSYLGHTRVGGIDLNRPRMRSALHAAQALCLRPKGFTVAEFAAQVRRLTGQSPAEYSLRQASYDLRKIRAQGLIVKPERSRRYQLPASGARTISALLTLPGHRPSSGRSPEPCLPAQARLLHLSRQPLRDHPCRDAGLVQRPRNRRIETIFC